MSSERKRRRRMVENDDALENSKARRSANDVDNDLEQDRDNDDFDTDRDQDADIRDAGVRSTRRRFRWPIRTILALGSVAVMIGLLPQIVSMPAVRDRVVAAATKNLNGNVQIGSASFGWFAPIVLQDVVVTDKDQKPVAQITRIASQRSLLGLAIDHQRLGTFRIEQPQLSLFLRADGSNLEDVIAPLMKTESSGSRTEISVEVVGGQIELRSDASDKVCTIRELEASFKQPLEATGVQEGSFSARVAVNDAPEVGEVVGKLQSIASGPEAGGKVVVQTRAIPLDMLDAPLRRFAGDYRIEGDADSDLALEWSINNEGQTSALVEIHSLELGTIAVAAPSVLGNDEIRSQRVALKGRVGMSGTRCEIDQVSLVTDVGSLEASGITDLAAWKGGGIGAALQALQNDDFSARGQIDLARVAQLLPNTLRIREGTEITSGQVQLEFTSHIDNNQRQWDAKLQTSDLSASDHGRPVTWERPLEIRLAAHQEANGIVIEQLSCDASFLQASAQGTLDAGQMALQGDLNQLAQELDRFIDLGDATLGGKLRGDVSWQRDRSGDVAARGELRLENLSVALGQGRPWSEQLLVLTLDAQAVAAGAAIERIERLQIEMTSGNDRMVAQLLEPVAPVSKDSTFPIECSLNGNLTSWVPRVQAVYPLQGYDLAGRIEFVQRGIVKLDGLKIDKATLGLSQLTVIGNGLFLDDQDLQAELTDVTVTTAGKFALGQLLLQSYPVSLRADNVQVTPTPQGPQISAAIGFRGDLERIVSCVRDPRVPPTMRINGEALGQVQLVHRGSSADARWKIDLTNFAYNTPVTPSSEPSRRSIAAAPASRNGNWQTVWSEPKLHFEGAGKIRTEDFGMEIASLKLDSESLQVDARGTIDEPNGRCLLNVEGEIAYDTAAVAALLHGFAGDAIRVEAKDRSQFSLRGPARNPTMDTAPAGSSRLASLPSAGDKANANMMAWLPSELAADANVGWNRAVAYGMPIGPASIKAHLAEGVLEIDPLDVDVSGGRMQLAPQVLFNRPNPLIVAAAGPVLTDVKLTPEMCGHWLKFVLPLLSDVTQAQGQLSLSLSDTASIPLQDPLAGSVQGELQLQSAQVGLGPMAQELLWLALEIKSLIDRKPGGSDAVRNLALDIPPQRVPFNWKDRRVYHDQMHFLVKDIAIKTSGSVGIDQTVDVIAEFPIPDEWLARSSYLSALKGQTVKIPIGGTLTRPKVDHRIAQQFLKDAARETVTNGAQKVIEGQLNRGFEKLDRLLGPKPQPKP